MADGDHLIKARVTEHQKRHDTLDEVVARRMEELLKGQLSERQLSPKELKNMADELIADIAAPPWSTNEVD
jgi:hypothetical protein